MSEGSVADSVLVALSLVEEGDLDNALAVLVELSSQYSGHPDVADAWTALGDAVPARSDFGRTLLQALVPVARAWPDARGRSTLMMTLAELEVTHREVAWGAHWLKAAMAADPADPRPWDLLELMLDEHPTLPVGRDTKKMLRELRKARGDEPVNEEDFAGATFDTWEDGGD